MSEVPLSGTTYAPTRHFGDVREAITSYNVQGYLAQKKPPLP